MNIETYEELTGKTVPLAKKAYYKAMIKKAQYKLETLLGYSLEPQARFIELGKAQQECVCPDIPESLLPPDEVKGIIKVFPFNKNDKNYATDPFLDVYNVKLVKVLENRKFISFKTFENVTPHYENTGYGKYIEKCLDCFCDCNCEDCVQLAVDGKWIDKNNEEGIPLELLYLLCEMVDYEADEYRDIKSESVDGHSWSRGDVVAPEKDETNLLIIKKYAGPFGSVVKVPTI